MEQITITIKRNGKATVEANGVKGSGCKELTRALENSLGKVSNDIEKQEMYETPNVDVENQY